MATANQHKPNDFTPVTAAMDLADYVFHITDSTRNFPDFKVSKKKNEDGTVTEIITQSEDSLVNRVREQAWQIYILTFSANEINVTKHPTMKNDRLKKQEEAMKLCTEHLAAVQLCRKHFHLSSKKIKYWGSKVRELRFCLDRWNESDKDRYKRI